MKVRLFNLGDQKSWDEYVFNHPDATNAHLIGWKEVIEKTYNKKSYYLIAERNKNIVGILPLFHIKSLFFGNQLVSMPYMTYGGILAESNEVAVMIIEKALAICKELKADSIELRDFRSFELEIFDHGKTQINSTKISMRLELPDSTENLFNSFKSKLRSQIRRPQKEGMDFVLGGRELVDEFYEVFKVNMRDLGSPVHSKKLFYNIAQQFRDNTKIGVVYFNSKPVASGMIVIFRDMIEIPWASSLRIYNRLSPNMLLYWSFLEYATKNRFKYFDFGRCSSDEGTYKFKKQWETQEHQLYWYRIFTDSDKTNSTGKSSHRDIVEKIWALMPNRLAGYIGPKVRKNISL
jgi:FemAB-related protein (PEP-CTERM system-associated)